MTKLDEIIIALQRQRVRPAPFVLERHRAASVHRGIDALRVRREKLFEAVEEDIADASAKHGAQRAVEHDVGDLLRRPVGVEAARTFVAEPPRHGECGEIRKTVPADRNRSVADDHRVDVGIVQKLLRVFER